MEKRKTRIHTIRLTSYGSLYSHELEATRREPWDSPMAHAREKHGALRGSHMILPAQVPSREGFPMDGDTCLGGFERHVALCGLSRKNKRLRRERNFLGAISDEQNLITFGWSTIACINSFKNSKKKGEKFGTYFCLGILSSWLPLLILQVSLNFRILF